MTFGSDARTVFWLYRRDFIAPTEFSVESIRGARLAGARPRASSFFPVAVNIAAGRVAFHGEISAKDARSGLQWASFDFLRTGFVDDTNGICDWSPDGLGLVYEKQSGIYVFTALSGVSKLLTQGSDPTWSPNGKSIAYTTPDGNAALTDVDGTPSRWPIADHKPMGPMRWSPDGRYLLFAEAITGPHVPLVTAYYQLLTCRISDGECISVRKFGADSGDTGNFYWITDYTNFCHGCAAAQPFN